MKVHPLISAHGQTYDRSFPLILVIGREPNNCSVSNGNIGLYNFVKYTRCAFWNVGFTLLGRLNNKSCRDIKREFIQHNASPILFADAFPQGIKNAVNNKATIRLKQVEFAHEQVEAILKHTEVIKRVKLLLLSGHDSDLFKEFNSLITDKFSELGIQVRNVPFFYPTNLPKIIQGLSDEDRVLINSIYGSYIEEVEHLPILSDELTGKYEMDAPDADEGIVFLN